jgi:hypothetical protein
MSAGSSADRPAGTSADEKDANPASLASSAGSTAGMSAVTNLLSAVMPTDVSADGRWLTYDELAELRGIDRTSARRLTTRLKWLRRPGNDGTVRILVPLRHLRPPRRSADRPAGIAADTATAPAVMPAVMTATPADLSAVIVPLEAAIDALREQLTAANASAGQALALADRLTGQLAEAQAARSLPAWLPSGRLSRS